jgi:energy-coupling factor transport system permease protein
VTDRSPPAFVRRIPTGPYRRLNPATKLIVALTEVIVALTGGAWLGPLLVLAAVLASAAVAQTVRRLAVVAAVTFPVVISILVVNTFVYPGASDRITTLGPLAPTWSGLAFGVQVTLRLLAMSLALALVYLTTPADDLLADLERRGLGRRAVFVVGATLRMVPWTIERGVAIVEAQRARGLPNEGRPWQRVRGVLPLVGPVISGALLAVEERALALEARAFTAPGRRTALRVLPDSRAQQAARWALTGGAVASIVVALGGWVRLP